MANGFGGQMDPLAGPAQTSPPRSPEEFEGLRSSWMGFLTRPETQAGLLQFAASVLQPVGRGQSVLGNIGLALGDAGAAAGRAATAGANEQQRQIENVQKERQIAVQERTSAQNEQQLRESTRQFDLEHGFQKEKLGKELSFEERKLNEYLIPMMGKYGTSTSASGQTPRDRLQLELMKAALKAQADADLTGEEFDSDGFITQGMAVIDQMAPGGQTGATPPPGTPTGAGGAPGAPAPGNMATNVLVQMAKDAIAAGADRNAVAQRLREQGVDPALLGQ